VVDARYDSAEEIQIDEVEETWEHQKTFLIFTLVLLMKYKSTIIDDPQECQWPRSGKVRAHLLT